jgi:signal transduction histidine kinase
MKTLKYNTESKLPIFKYILLALILWNLVSKSDSPIRAILILLMSISLILEILSTYKINARLYTIFKYIIPIPIFITMYFDHSSSLIYVYIYVLTYLSIYAKHTKETFIYLSLLMLSFLLVITLKGLPFSSLQNYLHHIYAYFLPYLLTIGFSLLGYNRRTSRLEISTLNTELTIQNKKLQEYASQIEELTLSDERNRVAQELHDSLGHYLMAISMHLDILKKLKDSPQKSEQVLDKTKLIVKDSIAELRNTVFELKEMKNSTILSESINDLLQTTSPLSEIKFSVDIDSAIENFSPFIKTIIYKTVQESLTNGIKHGKSTEFEIKVKVNESINISIRNYGIPPSDIIKSNGLKGINERISLTRGTCDFKILNDGFLVLAIIPIRKEDKID